MDNEVRDDWLSRESDALGSVSLAVFPSSEALHDAAPADDISLFDQARKMAPLDDNIILPTYSILLLTSTSERQMCHSIYHLHQSSAKATKHYISLYSHRAM
jgi:hypothetical protein